MVTLAPAARLPREALKVPPLMLPTSLLQDRPRSEERRVGKEWGARAAPLLSTKEKCTRSVAWTVSPTTLPIARLGASTMSLNEELTFPGMLCVELGVVVFLCVAL